MRESDIYLAGFLQYLRIEEHRALEYFTNDHESGIRTSCELLKARQEFAKRFPVAIQGYLMRTALTLSEGFRQTCLLHYNEKKDWVETTVYAELGAKFNYFIKWVRTASMKHSRFANFEINSAIYLNKKYWKAEQLTDEVLFWHWTSLVDNPRDLEGLQFFLRKMLGENERLNRVIDRLHNLIDIQSPYMRSQIRLRLIPDVLCYIKWLTQANPIDRFSHFTLSADKFK